MARTRIPAICRFLFLFYIFSGDAFAGPEAPPNGFDGNERDALLSLRKTFNNPFLNRNWTGLQCYLNQPPNWFGINCVDGRVTGVKLEGLSLFGMIKNDSLIYLTELTLLSFKNNSISGTIMDFSSNRKLTQIDLSDNKFTGPIPESLTGLDRLQSLQLQNNSLFGEIPAFNQESLVLFDVSSNNLSGPIPATPVLLSMDSSSFSGNLGLCGPPSPAICPDSRSKGHDSVKPLLGSKTEKSKLFTGSLLVAIFVILDVIALFLVTLFFFIYYKKVKSAKKMKEIDSKTEKGKVEMRETRVVEEDRGKLSFVDEQGQFELGDLLKASAESLGTGNFGISYKAMLEGRPAVVVKRLKDLNPVSDEEFARHMRFIADLKHPNLVPLLAYYRSKEEKLLVYEFAENGNLFNRIHASRGKNRVPFTWNSRLSAAQDVARAMAFLHIKTKSHASIPHGNLSSSNVLLAGDDRVLVSDYAFSPLIALPVAVQRMVSYRSPEYQYRRKISPKSDVWSYGCLLLELLTGRVPSQSAPEGVNGVDLCSWVHRAVREEWTAEVFDPEISRQRYGAQGMLKMLQIALRCSEKSPENRPEMWEVAKEMEEIQARDTEDEDSSGRSFSNDSVSVSRNSASGEYSDP